MAIKILSIPDFTGGRNSNSSSPALKANESLSQENTWTENGALIKRNGHTGVEIKIGEVPGHILKLCPTPFATDAKTRLVMLAKISAVGASRLIYTDNGTGFANCEATPTMLHASSLPFMGMFGSYLYVSDGINDVVRYNGTAVSAVNDFPKSSKCAVHKNYIFSATGNILKWSEINDPTTWPVNNFQTIGSGDNDIIMGLFSTGNGLLVFKRHSMWLLIGEVFDPLEMEYYIQKIDTPSDFNFLFPDTVVVHKGAIKFLTVSGFYAYTGGNNIYKISDNIQPDIENINHSGVYTPNTAVYYANKSPSSFIYKDRMYCCVLDSTGYRIFIVQDEKDKWWWWPEVSYASAVMRVIPVSFGTGSAKLYGGTPEINYFFTMDTGYNTGIGGTAISANWTSKDFVFPSLMKFLYLDITLKKQTEGVLTALISVDGGAYFTFSVDMATGVETILRKRVPIMRVGRTIRVRVSNYALAVGFEVYRMDIAYESTMAIR